MPNRHTLYRRLRRNLGSLFRDRSGSMLVELAVVAPVCAMILLGTFDMAQYILLNQKLNRAATTMADLVSQPSTITEAELNQLFAAAQQLVEPFDLPGNGRVIVSSISRPAGEDPRIDWQREGGSLLSASSHIGVADGEPNMPNGFVFLDNESVIAAEVFFSFEPVIFSGFIPSGVIRHSSFRRPRLGVLSTLN